MSQWLRRASQGHGYSVYEREVTGSKSSRIELGMHSTSVSKSDLNQNYEMYEVFHFVHSCKHPNEV